jgi:hypothetical protein
VNDAVARRDDPIACQRAAASSREQEFDCTVVAEIRAGSPLLRVENLAGTVAYLQARAGQKLLDLAREQRLRPFLIKEDGKLQARRACVQD